MVPSPIQVTNVGLDDYNNARKVWWTVDVNGSLSPPPEQIQEAFFDGHEKSNAPVSELEKPLVAVMGMDQHGLHLAKAFGKHYDTFAYDESKKRLEAVHEELSMLPNVVSSSDMTCLTDATHFIVAVPTTITPEGALDTTSIRTALSTIALYARVRSTVILESSVSISTSRSLLQELVVSKDIKAGVSPSRLDSTITSTSMFTTTPKIISALDGSTPPSLASIMTLYTPVFDSLIPISRAVEASEPETSSHQELQPVHATPTSETLATPTLFKDPFTKSSIVSSQLSNFNTSATLAQKRRPSTFSASRSSSISGSYDTPKARADRAMKTLLCASRRRSSWTVQSRRPRVLVVGLGLPFPSTSSSLSAHKTDTAIASPGTAIVNRLLTRWDVGVEFVDPRVSHEDAEEMGVRKFDDECKWHTMGLSWFDLVVIVQDVAVLGLDVEALERLPRTVVVDVRVE